METPKRMDISHLIQLATAFSVLVGIGLVVFELRQAKAIATANLIAQQFQFGSAQTTAMLGDNAAQSWVKGCIDPEALDPEDVAILDIIHWSIFNKINLLGILRDRANLDLELTSYAEGVAKEIFATPYGRSWWEVNRAGLPVALVSLGDPILADIGPPRCLETYKGYTDPSTTKLVLSGEDDSMKHGDE